MNIRILAITAAAFLLFTPLRAQWRPESSSGLKARFSAVSAVSEGKVCIFGGMSIVNGPTDSLQVFDPAKNAWSTPPLPDSFPHESAFSYQSKIYVSGIEQAPSGSWSLAVFDPVGLTWSIPITSGVHAGGPILGVINGELYCDAAKDRLEALNLTTLHWRTISCPFPGQSRYDLGVLNDTIFSYENQSIYAWSLLNPSWTLLATEGLYRMRTGYDIVLAGRKFYMIGGDTMGRIRPVNFVDSFDPATRTWAVESNENLVPRMDLTCCSDGNKIYAIGGYEPHVALSTFQSFAITSKVNTPTRVGLDSVVLVSSRGGWDIHNLPIDGTLVKLYDQIGRLLVSADGRSSDLKLYGVFPSGRYYIQITSAKRTQVVAVYR